MVYKFTNFPLIIEVGEGVLKNFEEIIRKNNLYFEKFLIITGEKSGEIVKKYLQCKNGSYYLFERFERDFLLLRKKVIEENYDLIVACGGGNIIDIGKYLAYETLTPLITVPTLLSSDAISSPISIIRINNYYKSFGTTMPIGILVDIEIIKRSPKQYTLAGLGDLISNISASYDWLLAHRKIGEKIDNFSRILSYNSAASIINGFERYVSINDKKFLEDLSYGLISSGIAINIAHSSRPASGSEHNISHALDKILKRRKLHGLQVGFATILTTYLQKQFEFHNKILEIYNKFKFPTNLNDLNIREEIFLKALELAPKIRNRYTILNEYDINSIKRIFKKILCF